MSVVLAEFGTGQVFWSFLWFFLFFHLDLAVDHGLQRRLPQPGPLGLGQGAVEHLHHRRAVPRCVRLLDRSRAQDERARPTAGPGAGRAQFRQYVQQAAGTTGGASTADELKRLSGLHQQGILNDAEYAQAKAKALGT